jgi:hypothetical protein
VADKVCQRTFQPVREERLWEEGEGSGARLRGRGDRIILEAIQTREAAMAPPTTRRTLLAAGTMLLAGPATAQPATTFKLYAFGYDVDTAVIAAEVPQRTGGRYRIEQIVGFDQVEAALGKERTAGGDRALLEGSVRSRATASGGPGPA